MTQATCPLSEMFWDYTNKALWHRDLQLDYDTNTGTAPAQYQVVRGGTTGATGVIIEGSDLGGTDATGCFTLSCVNGRFADGCTLIVLDTVAFDTVDSTMCGFKSGDTLGGPTTEDFDVFHVRYNCPMNGDGKGLAHGLIQTSGFACGEAIDNTTDAACCVAVVDAGAEVDNSALFSNALVNEMCTGTGSPLAFHGIIHYDGGTQGIVADNELVAGVQGTQLLTMTACQPVNNDTVTVGATTYRFRACGLLAANDVLVGASVCATMRNLIYAINVICSPGIASEGTQYANGTDENVEATAVRVTATTMRVEAKIPNDNTVVTTEVGCQTSFGAGTVACASGSTGRALAWGRTDASSDTTGSIVINDFTGAWVDNDTIFIDNKVTYDNIQSCQSFSEDQIVEGQSSGARGRIIQTIGSTDIILTEMTGRFEDNEQIHVVAKTEATTYTADVNSATGDGTLTAITVNHPNSAPTPRVVQKDVLQGGIYSDSINGIRRMRYVFNKIIDHFFKNFDQFDDRVPMDGSVRDGQYNMSNDWWVNPKFTYFITTGSLTDTDSDNIWANPQSVGGQKDMDSDGFGGTNPMPQLYIEQDGVEISPFWLEGQLDTLVPIKSNSNLKYLTATAGEGASIDCGKLRGYNRNFGHTYSHFATKTNTSGGVITIALSTDTDVFNTTGEHTMAYESGCGTWNVGEEFFNADTACVQSIGVVVTAGTGATGTITYILKSGHQFADADVMTSQITRVTKQVDECGGFDSTNDLVAGYSDKIGGGHVNTTFTGGTASGCGFQLGEGITQATSCATGVFLEDDANTIYLDERTGTFTSCNNLVGDESCVTYTPTTRNTAITTVPKDIGNCTDDNYGSVWGLNKTATTSRTIKEFYEYTKYLNAKESNILQAGRGTCDNEVLGKFYRAVDQTCTTPTFTELTGFPYGQQAGCQFRGATSVFVGCTSAADLQNRALIDECGNALSPPNLQAYAVTGLNACTIVVGYRSTGCGAVLPLTTEFTVGAVSGCNNGSTDAIILLAAGGRSICPLPDDIPTSGTLRVEFPTNTGLFRNFVYASRCKAANTFTLATNADQPCGLIGCVTCCTDLTATDDAFVTLLSVVSDTSTESKTIQFVSCIDTVVYIRKRGFKPQVTAGTFTSTGFSTPAANTCCNVVNPA